MAADNSVNDKSCLGECSTSARASTGSRAVAILCGNRYAANFGTGVGRDRDSIVLSIRKYGTDRFLCVGERFLLVVTFSDNFRKSRNKHSKAATLLRLKNDREAVILCHYVLLLSRRL